MSFRESVIIPYSLFKKCQFATPPLPPPPPLPRREPTPDNDQPPPAPFIRTPSPQEEEIKQLPWPTQKMEEEPPPPPPPPPAEERRQPPPVVWAKKEEQQEDDGGDSEVTNMARIVPEQDRPIVENILQRIQAHPNVVRWNNNFEVIVNGVTYPHSNILDLLKFIMKKRVIENNKGAPFGGKEFVDALIDKIKVPRDWIKVIFKRTSKRKRSFSVSGEGNDDDDDAEPPGTVRPFLKKPRVQMGRGGIPWITY